MEMKSNAAEDAKRRCICLIDEIEHLPASIASSCKRTLLRLCRSELAFLARRASPPSRSSADVPLSANIGHLEAVVHILQQPLISGVSRVCKPIPQLPANSKVHRRDSNCEAAHVDIVCTYKGNPAWVIVSDRNPKYVSWHDSNKCKGLRSRIQQILDVARSSLTLRPSLIVLFFSRGMSDTILEKIVNEFGAFKSTIGGDTSVLHISFSEQLEDEWVSILPRSYRESVVLEIVVDNFEKTAPHLEYGPSELIQVATTVKASVENANSNPPATFGALVSRLRPLNEMEGIASTVPQKSLGIGGLINFDMTALIALVSDISNGGTEKILTAAESELRLRFKGNLPFVVAQAKSEVQNPILPELGAVICGKIGMICASVLSEFKELIEMCGGPKEKLRAEQILKQLVVVPDNPSDRMVGLPTTRKLAHKNKVVFGTGDYWHAPTLTANMAFVRAVSQTGMSLHTIGHRPRALTGD